MLIAYNADLLPRVRMMGFIRYSEPWIHFARTIDEYVLYVLRDGDLYLQEDGVRYHLTAGDFFLLEPGLPHVGYQKAACDYYYAHFTHPDMRRALDDASALETMAENRQKSLISYNLDVEDPIGSVTYLPKQFHLPGTAHIAQLHTAVECYNNREEHYKRMTSAQIHCFFLQVAHEYLMAERVNAQRRRRKSDIVAEQVVEYLNQNYAQTITSEGLAERFEMNFDYMNRVVSSITGHPIFSYLNILRINHAKQLIATTDLPFSEIAYLVGIEDRYYFSKLFRKLTGLSPTEYYKETRSGNAE